MHSKVNLTSLLVMLCMALMLAVWTFAHNNALLSDFSLPINLVSVLPNSTDKNSTDPNERNGTSTRILCWIMTGSQYHSSRAQFVKQTWAKRCDKHMFMSDEENADLPAINMNTSTGRHFLWQKTKRALSYLYEHYYDSYDWFLKADDDTYVIVENLRYFLNSMDANSPLYFGCHIRGLNGSPKQGYMSGGAGYVLSRTALKKFVTEAMKDPNKCHVNGYSEDVEVGVCLENVNVSTGDTRDEHKRHRFLPISLEKVLVWKENDAQAQWFQGYAVHQIKKPKQLKQNTWRCSSQRSVDTHMCRWA
ncbi:Glycoprotein-N-acetylgalactosamine 3-beta-galactosyltransferase 1 [Toxocara canis]|uniref:Glycoprotein-N-acetylgalactosamine 3-beta-galactosyltransferase 1 n=1 Tax=Toxocara canis TaxID=6265 RepID=A0A0B2UYI5_TOXCA|nr:Glycoprotein-N-acetylgalactosamine 3-beta-galactosyltransferase 1 [Toxocara canis]